MRNARRMDRNITLGQVPDAEDLAQLAELGFRTVVDVREEDEKFGGRVEKMSREKGLGYMSISIRREEIHLDDVLRFYHVVYDKDGGPYYVFSRYGKKPLAFLLLFEAVAAGDPLGRVFQRASRIGIDLRGDLPLQSFLVNFYNSSCIEEVVGAIRELRPDLLEGREAGRAPFAGFVQRQDREAVMGQKGCTVWLTGLPCAGKSTTAFALERDLSRLGFVAYVLDSDSIRGGLSTDLGFSATDRSENIRRVGHVAKLFADSGAVAITGFISPYRRDRDAVRAVHEDAGLGFVEVFVDTPLEICEHRDRRGLYSRARSGELHEFTGVSDPYEPPSSPELTVKPAESTPDQISERIISHLREKGYLMRSSLRRA